MSSSVQLQRYAHSTSKLKYVIGSIQLYLILNLNSVSMDGRVHIEDGAPSQEQDIRISSRAMKACPVLRKRPFNGSIIRNSDLAVFQAIVEHLCGVPLTDTVQPKRG